MYKNCIDFSDSVKINILSNFSFFNLKNLIIYLKCIWMSIREKKSEWITSQLNKNECFFLKRLLSSSRQKYKSVSSNTSKHHRFYDVLTHLCVCFLCHIQDMPLFCFYCMTASQ